MNRYVLFLQVVAWPFLALAAEPEAPKAPPPPAEKPKLAVTISKETTFITEPLAADGYPDYELVMERAARQGVTAKNNAVVLLMRALGPGLGEDEEADEVYEKLELEPLETDKLHYFEKWQDYVERLPEDKLPPPNELDPPQLGGASVYEGQVRLRLQQPSAPWKRAQYPQMSAWLDQNAAPLDKLHEIGKHTHFYSPKSKTYDLFSYAQLKEYCTAIARRALRDGGEERWDAAWAGVSNLLILAQRFNEVPDRSEQEAAAEIYRIGFDTAQALALDSRVDAARLRRWSDEVNQRTITSTQRCFTWHERLQELHDMVRLAKSEKRPDYIAWNNPPWHLAYTLHEAYDFNQALRQINAHYERIDKGYQDLQRGKPASLYALNGEDFDFHEFFRNPIAQLGMLKATKEQRTELLVKLRLPTPQFTLIDTFEHELSSRAWWDLTRLHMALELYRREHGKYPKELSALTPKFIAQVPLDLFTDEKPFCYRTNGRGFLLYSVGHDGKDSNGQNTMHNELRWNDRLDDLAVYSADHQSR
jgi:hypothetical protein